jgi:TM2 domain-containing membrane protein YozV
MPAAWREPADGGEKPGPRPPSIRNPVSGPPVQPVQPPRPPVMRPPHVATPRFAVPPPHLSGPAFGPTVPPYAQQPLTTVVPATPRPRPVSPIPYPGLPLSVPPMVAGLAPGIFPARVDPQTGEPLSDRSSLTAGLLQIFLGAFGAGRLYTGHVAIALLQMGTGLFLFMFTMCAGLGFDEQSIWALMWVGLAWPVIDGIVFLGWGGRDSNGHRLR